MKARPDGFLSYENIDHNGEIFDYIRELHEYLWRFIRVERPDANGYLRNYVDIAIKELEDE